MDKYNMIASCFTKNNFNNNYLLTINVFNENIVKKCMVKTHKKMNPTPA